MARNLGDANDDFNAAAHEIKKETDCEATVKLKEIKRTARDYRHEANDNLQEIKEMERIIDDSRSGENIREAKAWAKELKQKIKEDARIARKDVRMDKQDFKQTLKSSGKNVRDSSSPGMAYAEQERLADESLRARDNMEADLEEAYENMSRDSGIY